MQYNDQKKFYQLSPNPQVSPTVQGINSQLSYMANEYISPQNQQLKIAELGGFLRASYNESLQSYPGNVGPFLDLTNKQLTGYTDLVENKFKEINSHNPIFAQQYLNDKLSLLHELSHGASSPIKQMGLNDVPIYSLDRNGNTQVSTFSSQQQQNLERLDSLRPRVIGYSYTPSSSASLSSLARSPSLEEPTSQAGSGSTGSTPEPSSSARPPSPAGPNSSAGRASPNLSADIDSTGSTPGSSSREVSPIEFSTSFKTSIRFSNALPDGKSRQSVVGGGLRRAKDTNPGFTGVNQDVPFSQGSLSGVNQDVPFSQGSLSGGFLKKLLIKDLNALSKGLSSDLKSPTPPLKGGPVQGLLDR